MEGSFFVVYVKKMYKNAKNMSKCVIKWNNCIFFGSIILDYFVNGEEKGGDNSNFKSHFGDSRNYGNLFFDKEKPFV